MELITNWEDQHIDERPKTAFTIGVFDGLHLGHKYIIDQVIKNAAKLKAQSLVLTFEPHPLAVLAKEATPPTLTTIEHKCELLESWGLDRLGILRFSREMAATEPHKFLNQYIGRFIDAASIVLGPDFRFGKDAKGDPEAVEAWLKSVSPKARLTIVEPKSNDDGTFSSSQIRQDLKNGLVESAAKALGRPYRLYGEVVHGLARGRLLGFPTANLGGIEQLIPEPGVYAVMANIDGESYPGMTSIGYNQTFGEQPLTVETNIFGFERFIYGQKMSIDFIARLRAMVRFKSVEQLTVQLAKDRLTAESKLTGK